MVLPTGGVGLVSWVGDSREPTRGQCVIILSLLHQRGSRTVSRRPARARAITATSEASSSDVALRLTISPVLIQPVAGCQAGLYVFNCTMHEYNNTCRLDFLFKRKRYGMKCVCCFFKFNSNWYRRNWMVIHWLFAREVWYKLWRKHVYDSFVSRSVVQGCI